MSALSALADRLAELTGHRQPPAPPGFVAELPDVDEEASGGDDGNDGGASPIMIIEYEDSRGEFSRRRITVLKVQETDATTYLCAYCHERRAYRRFLLDRVQAFIDPVTGEYLDSRSVIRALEDFGEAAEEPRTNPAQYRAMEAAQPGILVLMLVAWADGRFQDAERVVVEDYVREVCADLTGWDIEPIMEWAGRQYPLPDSIAKRLAAIVRSDSDGSRMGRLLKAAIRLARADGVVVEEEALKVQAIRDARRIPLREMGCEAVEDFTAGWAFSVPLPAFADALDISYDQRMVKKRPVFVWTRGNPPEHRFKQGDVFHQTHPGRHTLQVSRVDDSGGLDQPQAVTFSVFKRRYDGTMSRVGENTVSALEFEAVLRGEAPQWIVEAKFRLSAALS